MHTLPPEPLQTAHVDGVDTETGRDLPDVREGDAGETHSPSTGRVGRQGGRRGRCSNI